MYFIGIDIGSTAAKTAVFEGERLCFVHTVPTGWSSATTAQSIKEELMLQGVDVEQARVFATGYGRISVPYANKAVTEITCHGKGAAHLFSDPNALVIDIGGQDTKVISMAQGVVQDFLMNDKCSAGTGRFLEIMANALGVGIDDLCNLAQHGGGVTISSMCTVFAESEIISLVGSGRPREDIAYGIIQSIVTKVSAMYNRHRGGSARVYLTGGLCDCPYIVKQLSKEIGTEITTQSQARYAGAIGAAILAMDLK